MSTPLQSPTTDNLSQRIHTHTSSTPTAARREQVKLNVRAHRAKKRAAERTPERHEALSCAERIKGLVTEFPTLSAELNKFIYLLQHHGAHSHDRVQDAVELKLRQGCTGVEEICEETNLSELIVINTLEAMRAVGIVAYRARIVAGRPTQEMIWVLTGKPAITSAVRP
jgi:predicted transcriptional regulator